MILNTYKYMVKVFTCQEKLEISQILYLSYMEGFEYTSKFLYGKEVLFRGFEGELTVEAEIQMLQYAVDKGLINDRVVGMVLDMSKARFKMPPGEGIKIIDFTASVPLLAPLKYALIVDTPENIIFPLLGGILRDENKLQPFSTEQAAIKWVLT